MPAPERSERKRPLYLLIALVGALFLGTTDLNGGWALIAGYREPIDVTAEGQGVSDEADREAIVTRARAWVQALDAAKRRGWPVGVATMLLGGAAFILAVRALGGSRGARAALVQVVLVQAGAYAIGYWLLRDVGEQELRVLEAKNAAKIHEQYRDHLAERARADDFARRAWPVIRAAAPPVFVGLRTLGSLLVVVALTRRRSREFFDAASPAVEER